MEEALWVTVKDRVHCSVTELFLVPCNGLFGGLGPFKGLKMKPVHHLLPSALFFFFKIFLMWTIFSLYWICYDITSDLCFLAMRQVGILVPRPGIEPPPPALEAKVLPLNRQRSPPSSPLGPFLYFLTSPESSLPMPYSSAHWNLKSNLDFLTITHLTVFLFKGLESGHHVPEGCRLSAGRGKSPVAEAHFQRLSSPWPCEVYTEHPWGQEDVSKHTYWWCSSRDVVWCGRKSIGQQAQVSGFKSKVLSTAPSLKSCLGTHTTWRTLPGTPRETEDRVSLSLSRIQCNKAAGPNTKWYKTWVWSAYVHVLRCSVMSDSLWLQRSLPGLLCPLEFFQARILEWVALSSSGGSSQPRDWTPVSYISCLSSRFFTTSATGEVQPVDAGEIQSVRAGSCQRISPVKPGPRPQESSTWKWWRL